MRLSFIAFTILITYSYFSCQQEASSYITLTGQAQGTTFKITYKDSLRRDFSMDVDSLFRHIDSSMSLWDPNSIISRVNRNDSLIEVDEHFQKVIHRSTDISTRTDGAFDITVGPLVQTWKKSLKEGSGPPDSVIIKQLLDQTGYRKIKLVNSQVIKSRPDVQIDLNGIAQGYTVDLLAAYLQNQGIHNFLVEVGGEVSASGLNERGTCWQVGIDKPIDTISAGRPLQTTVPLDKQAMATSGSYRNYLEKEGKKFNHIINPKTGYPVEHDLVSVTVIAEDCMTADALATAFMVIGRDSAIVMAGREKVEILCIYIDEKGNMQEKATAGFLK